MTPQHPRVGAPSFVGVEGGLSPNSRARGGLWGKDRVPVDPKATSIELAFALLSWLGGRQARTSMASAHPPDPSYVCMLGVVSVSLTALEFAGGAFHGRM